MLKKILLIVICLLLSFSFVHCQEQDDDRDDTEAFQYQEDFEFLEERATISQEAHDSQESVLKLRPLAGQEDFNQVHDEVEHLIGLQDEEKDKEGHVLHPANMTNLKQVLQNNRQWVKSKTKNDANFFKNHKPSQKPNYLWIGCSDSRLPANEILGLDYGEVFVMRNVANIVSPSDISSLAVLQYAVQVLKVKDIIVAGHYGCGGVKAAVTKYNHGPLEAWLSKLRRIRHKHAQAFSHLNTLQQKADLLVEINVKEQVFNVASTPFVQQAWAEGQQLRIHGVVFDMDTGRLIDLHMTMHEAAQIPDELVVIDRE